MNKKMNKEIASLKVNWLGEIGVVYPQLSQ